MPASPGASRTPRRDSGGSPGCGEDEDHVSALLRFAGGAPRAGRAAWDFRRTGGLRVALDLDYSNAAYARRQVGPVDRKFGDGEFGAFQPGAGIAMSFDDLKVIELHRLVQSIATGQPIGATIDDALRAAEPVDPLADSADRRAWVRVDR